MAKLLLLETATNICSVGFAKDDQFLLEKVASKPMGHTEELTLLIQQGMKELDWQMTELDGIILSKGPGSYTALRVGAATAKGICYSLGIPLIAVDTLHALSWGMFQRIEDIAQKTTKVFPMIDARRMEVYGAIYSASPAKVSPAQAIILDKKFLEELIPNDGILYIGGSGAAKAKQLSNNDRIKLISIECSAEYLLKPGLNSWKDSKYEDVAYFKPQYLKPPNITTPKPIWK